MDSMGTANGHHLEPFALQPLQTAPRGPVAPWPQDDGQEAPEPGRWRHVASAARHAATSHRAWLAAVPVILVNAVAFAGQLAFLRTHLPWPLAGQVLVAVTLESVAVYLAWQAHLALAADDSAMRLRLAAYGFAAVIGLMNYSHYMAPGWRPTFAAVTFGLMSVSSPWLWSVHSRRVTRDALKARGLIEPHAVRLGATRLMWHPFRCVRVMSRATWTGENDPAVAIALPPVKAMLAAQDDTAADLPVDAEPDPSPDEPESSQAVVSEDTGEQPAPPSPHTTPKPRPRVSRQSARAKALATLKANPGLTDAEVMKRAKVSESTAQRARKDLAKETP